MEAVQSNLMGVFWAEFCVALFCRLFAKAVC